MLRVQDYVQRADEFKNKNVEVRLASILWPKSTLRP